MDSKVELFHALSNTKTSALAMTYELERETGSRIAHSKSCGASQMDTTSCIVRDVAELEMALRDESHESSGVPKKVIKRLEKHLTNLSRFLESSNLPTVTPSKPVHTSTLSPDAPVNSDMRTTMNTLQTKTKGTHIEQASGTPTTTDTGDLPMMTA